MAGTPEGTPVSGAAPQEAGQPQVEYRPFSDLSPQELATLTGGRFSEQPEAKSSSIDFPYWSISYGDKGLNWVDPSYGMRGASIDAPYLISGLNEGYSLTWSVVITRPDQPGIVTFVDPREFLEEHDQTEVYYDWITVEDRGIRIERAPEGSSRVTDEIRHADKIAQDVIQQRLAAARAREKTA